MRYPVRPASTIFRSASRVRAQGRWLVPDPAGMAAVDLSNPQTWNRYAYVANNPLNNVDPVGLDWDEGQPLPIPWGSNFCGGDPIACALGGWDVCVWAGLCSPGSGSGGGGSGSGGNQPSTPPSNPASNPPSKPVNFPNETNGIPNGLKVNFGGPLGAILPSAICGDLGPCPSIGNSLEPDEIALAAPLCAVQPEICIAAGIGGLAILAWEQYGPQIIQFARKPDLRQFDHTIRQIEQRCGRPLTKDERRRLHDEITKGGYSPQEQVEIGVGMFCPGR
jgi:hypothetical protein